jgi:DNA-binding winged helix-turn-helix (wHTH) protein
MTDSAQHIAYQFGSFTLDLERGALLATNGVEMALRPKSFALLRLLVQNAGRLLSRETILAALWPNVFVTDDNVMQCIHDIRGALGGEAEEMLRTLSRRGYLFTSKVVAVPATAALHHEPAPSVTTGLSTLLATDLGEPDERRLEPRPVERRQLDEQIVQIERPGWEERFAYAEILRLKGWMLSLKGDLEGAERDLLASLDWARRQQAKMWELRTSTSLARLWQSQGKRQDAYELLAPVYGWFTEGFDTKDLLEVKSLLAELQTQVFSLTENR